MLNENCTMPTFAKASAGKNGKNRAIRQLAERNLPLLPDRYWQVVTTIEHRDLDNFLYL
jgi:hypothetical protein